MRLKNFTFFIIYLICFSNFIFLSGKIRAQADLWRQISLGEQITANGIELVENADGLWRVTELGGQSCIEMTANAVSKAAYLYFAVEDSYLYNNAYDVFLSIEYFDRGSSHFTVEFDNGSESYQEAVSIALTSKNQWVKHSFILPRVGFTNKQANGADFRIAIPDTSKTFLAVKNVYVWRAPGEYVAPLQQNFTGESYSSDDYLVFTYYFYWYDIYSGLHIWDDPQHTDDALQDHPNTFDDFSFKSVAWHKRELLDMMEAKIDVILPVYWGAARMMEGWSVDGLENLVLAEQELIAEGKSVPKIGMFFDTSTLQYGEYVLRKESSPTDLNTSFGKALFFKHIRDFYSLIPPALWARIDDKPVVWLYAAAFAKNVNQNLINYVNLHFATSFPSSQPYIVRETSWNLVTANDYAWGAAVNGAQILGVAAVGPGYNDSAVPGRTTPITEREDGDFYQRNWQQVLASGRNFVAIETWNEFHEGTDICHSQEYGWQYIDMTTEFVRYFKQATKFFSFAPQGWIGVLHPSCSLLVQDKEHGINPVSTECQYSEDQGKSWKQWQASCTGLFGSKAVEKITAAEIPFSTSASLLTTNNYVRFSIINANGDTMSSPHYAVFNGHPSDYEAEIILGANPQENGISQSNHRNDDGWSAETTIGGVPCVYNLVENPSPYPGRYLYFNISDSLVFAGSHPQAWIMIDYYDTSATAKIELQYDSPGNDLSQKYRFGGAVYAANSRNWKKTVFHLQNAFFANRQNGKSDFRFYTSGVMFLSRVSVRSAEPVGVEEKHGNGHAETPEKYRLFQNYPNPFNHKTSIHYNLSVPAHVRLMIYDINGRKVQTIVTGFFTPGDYKFNWDACNQSHHQVSSGLYFYQLQVGALKQIRRMVLIR